MISRLQGAHGQHRVRSSGGLPAASLRRSSTSTQYLPESKPERWRFVGCPLILATLLWLAPDVQATVQAGLSAGVHNAAPLQLHHSSYTTLQTCPAAHLLCRTSLPCRISTCLHRMRLITVHLQDQIQAGDHSSHAAHRAAAQLESPSTRADECPAGQLQPCRPAQSCVSSSAFQSPAQYMPAWSYAPDTADDAFTALQAWVRRAAKAGDAEVLAIDERHRYVAARLRFALAGPPAAGLCMASATADGTRHC